MPYFLEKSWERSHKHFPEGMNLQMINDPYRLSRYHEYFEKHAKGKVILDVGAGLGLIGLKALEFGAAHVYLVEQNPHTASVLRKIISALPRPELVTLIENDFHTITRSHFSVTPDLLVCELWGPHLWNEGLYPTHAKARELFPEINIYPHTYKSHFNIVQIPSTETRIWPREQLPHINLTEIYKQEYLGYLLDRHDVKHQNLTEPQECFSLSGDQLISSFETTIPQNYKDVFFHLAHYIHWGDHQMFLRSTFFYIPEIKAGEKLNISLDEVYLPLFKLI